MFYQTRLQSHFSYFNGEKNDNPTAVAIGNAHVNFMVIFIFNYTFVSIS